MNRDTMNLSGTIDAARWYLQAGLSIVPTPARSKNPGIDKWEQKPFTLSDFTDGQNIGLKLGVEVDKDAYVVDVDLDLKLADKLTAWPGADVVVEELLFTCGLVFGRDSAPRSHRLYLVSRGIGTIQYAGLDDEILIELRGHSAKKKTPQHTVVPTGTHKSGERITFALFDHVAFRGTVFPADEMIAAVQRAAVALAILRVWPNQGRRHHARLAFSKILLEAGIAPENALRILEAVMKATGSDASDVVNAVHDTAAKDPAETMGALWIVENIERGADILKAIDKILGIKRRRKLAEDEFDVTDVDLKVITPAVWDRLNKANDPARLFLQGGLPVRATLIPENPALNKPATWALQILDESKLRHEVAQAVKFVRWNGRDYRQIPPPGEIVRDMLATPPAKIGLPIVNRIVYAPTMAPNGSIQTTPGYQPATSTFYVEPGFEVPSVSNSPTAEELARAVALILEPIQDFNFVADADRTHAVALLILPFVRSLIDGPTPLHLFVKPVAGAGATLLTDTLLFPSVGTNVSRMSTVDDEDEWRKQITATLLNAPSSVVIDNARDLIAMQLAKVLTDLIWEARILGVSKNAVLPVECAWVATGINPTLHQEISRRVVPCNLDPGVAQPWLRESFTIPNLREWSREHRADLIWAVLTLARAWHVAGRPKGPRSLGMYESWASVIGGIVTFAGFDGFLSNLLDLYESSDLEGSAVQWLVEEWKAHHGGQAVKLGDVRLWALTEDSPLRELVSSPEAFSKFVRGLLGRVVDVEGQPLSIDYVNKSQAKTSRQTFRLVSRGQASVDEPTKSAPTMPF